MYVIFLPSGALRQQGDMWTVRGTSGQPRCDKAAALYYQYHKQNMPVVVLVSGGITGDRQRSEAYYYRQYLTHNMGIPIAAILLEEASKLSTENVKNSVADYSDLLRAPDTKIIIVSQLIHSLRLNISFWRGYNVSVWQRQPIVTWWPHREGLYEVPCLGATLMDPRGEGGVFQWARRVRLS